MVKSRNGASLQRFGSDTLIAFSGALSARLIGFLSIPIITRIYAPEAYGVWPLLMACAAIVTPIATIRYEIAVILPKSDRVAASLVWLSSISTGTVVLALVALLSLAGAGVAELIGLPEGVGRLIFFIPAVVFLNSIQFISQAWLTRRKAFGAIAVAQVAQGFGIVFFALSLPYFLGPSGSVFALASLLGVLIGAAASVRAAVARGILKHFRILSLARLRKTFRSFRAYPLYMVPYSISASLVERLFQIGIASVFSVGTLGVYFIAQQLTHVPMVVLTSAMRQVLFAYVAKDVAPEEQGSMVCRLLTLVGSIQMPILGFALVFLPRISEILLGDTWVGVGAFAFWLVIPASVLMHTAWLDRMFDVRGRQRFAVGLQLCSDAILLGLLGAAFYLGVSELNAVAVVTIGVSVYNLTWLFITLGILGVEKRRRLGLISRGILLFATSYLLFSLLDSTIPNQIGLPVSIVALAVTLVVAAYRGRSAWLALQGTLARSMTSPP